MSDLILSGVRRPILTQTRVLGWVIYNPGQTIDHKMFFWLMCYLVDVWLISASDGMYAFLKFRL